MTQSTSVCVSPAEFPQDREVVAALFAAYAESLDIDLSFQNFTHELSQLPGKYSIEKGGALFLARVSGHQAKNATAYSRTSSKPPTHTSPLVPHVIGCVAVRGFNAPDTCELKRLYITPDARGLGAGRILMEAAIAKARELGYKEMLLDTLATMVAARGLYAKYGFKETEKYYDNPTKGVVFMKATL